MNLKDNLKKIRKDNNLSQEDLAEKLGVSRQAVSKWEQGLAYPEMDKVLQLCNMFNLNIDEILNQDIKEVEKNKQSKANVNKYIDEFLEYVKKTVKMFFNMKLSDKIKCIIEQLIIIFVLYVISQIIGSILDQVLNHMFSFLSLRTYNVIHGLLEGIYYLFILVLSIILLLYIFKIRYLDYYEIVENDKEEVKEETKEIVKEDKKIIKEKQEKIIIRDPKHSEYGFINAIVKLLLFIIKGILFFVGLGISISLVAMIMALVISFNFIKTGLLFIGGLLGCLSLIILHILFIYLIFSFISNIKIKKNLSFVIFITSIIVGGISCGLIINGLKDFKYIDGNDSNYFVTNKEEIEMDNNLVIQDYYGYITYKESNNKNILIEYKTAKYCKYEFNKYDNILHFYHNCDGEKFVKELIKNLNNKTIITAEPNEIILYTTKENIKILEDNVNKYNNSINENEKEELYNTIDNLNEELLNTKMELEECKNR